ncbi:hypothetical protein RF11_13550 [Thelohanellus kitauei]|uniref:Uncharacterized protein n=1 Tax=Thelohanellus kitauei TaxID=669202 RepID=A0A0C2N4W2_THEKT|nr:hypothetical protein RF11_13550 [Thelohanellus kitauei]
MDREWKRSRYFRHENFQRNMISRRTLLKTLKVFVIFFRIKKNLLKFHVATNDSQSSRMIFKAAKRFAILTNNLQICLRSCKDNKRFVLAINDLQSQKNVSVEHYN